MRVFDVEGDLEPGDNPAAWKVFKVFVGETGLPLNRPRTTEDNNDQ